MSNAIVVKQETPLPQLAESINSEHDEIIGAVRSGLRHAHQAGLSLMMAKAQVGHGQWEDWVKSNLNCSERTAQGYMQIAKRWDELQVIIAAKAQDPADIGLERALRLIATPKKMKAIVKKAPQENNQGVQQKKMQLEDVAELYHSTLSTLIQTLGGLAITGRYLPVRHQLLEQIVALVLHAHAALARIEGSVSKRTEVDAIAEPESHPDQGAENK